MPLLPWFQSGTIIGSVTRSSVAKFAKEGLPVCATLILLLLRQLCAPTPDGRCRRSARRVAVESGLLSLDIDGLPLDPEICGNPGMGMVRVQDQIFIFDKQYPIRLLAPDAQEL